MTQEEINRAEWENPENWSDNIVGAYLSKRNKRVWVPKRRAGFGWILNVGNRWGAWWLVGLLIIPPVLAGLLFRRTRGVSHDSFPKIRSHQARDTDTPRSDN
jgi:hypothetical protein